MFKKVEMWVVALLLIIFIISVVLYGGLLRAHYISVYDSIYPGKFPKLQRAAVFIAEIPSTIKRIIIARSLNLDNFPKVLTKHKNKPRYKRFINTNREALLILPRFDGNLMRSVVEIIDLNTFEILHIYKLDITSFNKLIDTTIKGNERLKIDHSEKRFEYRHALILEDGSLISSNEIAPLFKIDFCSQLLWINQEKQFHHSKMLDSDKNIWVGSKMYPYSKVFETGKPLRFNDDSITKVNQKGEILYIKSVSKILIENGIFGGELFHLGNDPIHLNDIEPAFHDTQYWKKGDLFLSIRNQSAIIHYRPSNNKVINYIQGPFYMQHDVAIISDKEISIFNNNNAVLENSKYSEILIYNFETKTFLKKFNKQLQENDFKSESNGIVEILKDGSMYIEENNHGRLIFFNKDGEKEWEFVNKDDNGNIYFFSWSRVVEDINLIDKLKEKIENTRCSD